MTASKKDSSNLPLVILVSDFSPLALALVELLEEKLCRVAVMSEDFDSWEKAFQENGSKNLSTLLVKKTAPCFSEVNYLICLYYPLVGVHCKEDFGLLQKKINLTKNFSINYKPKTLFIFPYLQDKEAHSFLSAQVESIFVDKDIYSGVLYLGDVILQKESVGDFLLGNLLKKSTADKVLTAHSSEQLFYPISLELTVQEIVKSLYSLGVYGKKTAIISKPLRIKDLQQIFIKMGAEIDLRNEKDKQENIQADVDEKTYLEEDGEMLIRKALGVIGMELKEEDFLVKKNNTTFGDEEMVKSEPKKEIQKVSNFFRRWRVGIVTLVLLIFLSPFLFLTMGGVALLAGKELFLSGDLRSSRVGLKTSLVLTRATGQYCLLLSKAPLINKPYQQIADLAWVLQKLSAAGLGGISAVEYLIDLSSAVVGEENYDLKTHSRQLFFELDSLYQELGFAQAEIQELESLPQKITSIILGDIKINLWREKILQMQKLSAEADALFGKEKETVYLVLFQNNSILRATGGLIESFGLATFSNGKLESFEIYDTSFIDRNLQGIVEPPMAIKEHLNETRWYLRDSNWSSDFPTSAAKAEWFLDKGMGRAVDGVIAFDLEFIKLILDKAGDVNLKNKDGLVNSESVYGVVGNFSRGDSYPELNEESFYTNLARAVFSKNVSFDNLGNLKFIKNVYENFNRKNIQLFLHNKNAQRALAELNWDGAVRGEVCSGNCYSDFLNLIESSTGSSHSHSITEELELSVSLEEGLIKRKLIVFLENPGDASYEAHLRVLVNADSGFDQVEIVGTEFKENLTPEVFATKGYKEAGVLVEILPKETKAIVFNWESGSELNFSREGEYALYWRKQAGVIDRLINIEVDIPEKMKVKDGQLFSLTEDGLYGYNTKLLEDFTTSILW
jgi:hypothetical protein